MTKPYIVPLDSRIQTVGLGIETNGIFQSGCPLCTPEESEEDVVSEMKRLSRMPPEETRRSKERRRRQLVYEIGNCHAILRCAWDELADARSHWAASKIQMELQNEEGGDSGTHHDINVCDTLCKQEVDEIEAGLQFTKTRMKIIEEQKETLDRQLEDDDSDPDPGKKLYAGCTSGLKDARAKHYMCHQCYESWIEKNGRNTCPWCRKEFQNVKGLQKPEVYHSRK